MYRRLEPKTDRIKASSKQVQEAVCTCNCKSESSREGKPEPEANLLGDQLAVDFRING